MSTDYARPQEVTDLDLAFPADLGDLLPPTAVIPADYPHRETWAALVHTWFYEGLDGQNIRMVAAPGVDAQTAGRHLTAVLRSFQPKHEHKMDAAAWLASRWFTHVTDGDGAVIAGAEPRDGEG